VKMLFEGGQIAYGQKLRIKSVHHH